MYEALEHWKEYQSKKQKKEKQINQVKNAVILFLLCLTLASCGGTYYACPGVDGGRPSSCGGR
tara:strand:- start:2056 stop:2244 length:189 start_codon:yes stop_codon:yes gene_type:complete